MPKLFVTLLLLGIVGSIEPSAGQSIPGEAVTLACMYQLTFRPDSTSTTTLVESMQLLVTRKYSVFGSKRNVAKDSIAKSFATMGKLDGTNTEELSRSLSAMLHMPGPRFTYQVVKFFDVKQCVVYDDILQEHYKYQESDYPLAWALSPATATIGGYQCQRATTSFAGRRYEAWFTREIPVSDGPYKFSGLPGLIVKLSDATGSYVFELTSAGKPIRPISAGLPIEVAMTTTKNTFLNALRASRATAIDQAAQYGVTFKNPEAVRAKMQDKLKHANNPLELKY